MPFLYIFFQIFGENRISKNKMLSVFAGEGNSSKETDNGYLKGSIALGVRFIKRG